MCDCECDDCEDGNHEDCEYDCEGSDEGDEYLEDSL
jgi:hypothetical protein